MVRGGAWAATNYSFQTISSGSELQREANRHWRMGAMGSRKLDYRKMTGLLKIVKNS